MACGSVDSNSNRLDEHLRLADERQLHIRPLRGGEDAAIRQLYTRLSPRTRYLRFLSPMPALPDSVLALLTAIDHRRLALVAEDDAAAGELVALASFGAVDDDRAEVALVVRDDWQHQHLGTELACRVLRAAEDRGFHRFVVYVTADNVAIRRLLAHVGEIVSANASGGVSEIEFVRRR